MRFPGTQAFANQLLLCSLLTIAGGGGVGLGAVWMHQQITLTAAANKTLERERAGLNRRLYDLDAQVESARTQSALEQGNYELNLGLDLPPRDRVIRVLEDPRLLLAAKRDQPVGLMGLAATARYHRPEDR